MLPWVTNELGHIRLASPPASLPAPATAAHTGVPWWYARTAVFEDQRQRDVAALAAKDETLDGLYRLVESQNDVIARLREDLARAGGA